MANLKAILKRINTVKSTQQITKAMKMVAAAKLRRTEGKTKSFRVYNSELEGIIQGVVEKGGIDHPFLKQRDERKILLVAFAADRGLCGSYNHNLVKKVEEFLKEHSDKEILIYFYGRKLKERFKKRNLNVIEYLPAITEHITFEEAVKEAEKIKKHFVDEEVDAVYVLFSFFRSPLRQEPMVRKVLPISIEKQEREQENLVDYIYEPSKEGVVHWLIESYFHSVIYDSMLEGVASEHAARMTAMDNATNNAEDMIYRLTLTYNKARQAAITTELMEIVTGAEALKQHS